MSSVSVMRFGTASVSRRTAVQGALLAIGSVVVTALALSSTTEGDYHPAGPVAGDNAGAAINALTHGDVGGLVSHQPLMGLVSILLRAPFVKLASSLGAGDMLVYRVGAIACILPAVLLGAWMISRRGLAITARLAAVIATALIVAGPATVDAIHLGHPEEVLAAVLATGAVLAAIRGRRGWAAVLLGLAVGTKQWAVLAAIPVLLALDDHRFATAVRAAGLALLLTAVLPIADPRAFARADSVVGGLNFTDPFSLWWPLGSRITAAVTAHRLPLGLTRSVASALACMAGLGVLAAYAAKRRSQRRAYDALALLALMGLLRCIADPDPLEYNFVALLIPLAAWEAVTLERLPIMSALATAAVAVLGTGSVAMMAGTAWSLGPAAVSALSLGWTLALASYLGYRAVSTRSSGVRRPKLPLVIRTASARGGS